MMSERWPRMRERFEWLGHPQLTVICLVTRAFAAIALFGWLWSDGPVWLAATVLVALTGWRNLRFARFNPAYCTMELIVLFPVALWSFDRSNELLGTICLSAIALHVVLVYAAQARVKLHFPKWRETGGLDIWLTYSRFRMPLGPWLEAHPRLLRTLFWSIVMFESTFFLALIAGPWVCLAFLLVGVLFHTGNTVIFGLHGFFWTLVGTYPAVWFVSGRIHTWLCGQLH